MAVNELTKFFVQNRKHRNRPFREESIEEDLPEKMAKSKTEFDIRYAPSWVKSFITLKELLYETSKELEALSLLYKSRLQVTFRKGKERNLEKRINKKCENIKNLFYRAENQIKKFSSVESEFNTGTLPDDEKQIRLNAMRFGGSKIRALSISFQRIQKESFKKIGKAQFRGQSIRDVVFDEDDKLIDFEPEENSDLLHESDLKREIIKSNRKNSYSVLENEETIKDEFESKKLLKKRIFPNKRRNRELQKIADSAQEISMLFKDLGALVIDQRTSLDRIDFAIEESKASLTSGLEEIQKTKEKQLKSTSTVCIFWLIIAIAICLVILVFKK